MCLFPDEEQGGSKKRSADSAFADSGKAPVPKRSSSHLSRRPDGGGDDENDEAVVGGSKKRKAPGVSSFDHDEEAERRKGNQQPSSSFLSPKPNRRPAAPGNSLYHCPAFCCVQHIFCSRGR